MRTKILALVLILGVTASFIPKARAGSVEPSLPIDHVVFVMQEDRTFDNYFGTYPGADGWPTGFSMPLDPTDPSKGVAEPHNLDVTRTPSLPHSASAMEGAMNGGQLDSFIASAENYGATDGTLALGYYDYEEIPLYWGLADRYVLADRWFSSVAGPSFPNHLFAYAASRTSTDGTQVYSSVPEQGMDIVTLFDRLEAEGISWKVYVQGYDPESNFRNAEARLGLTDSAAQLIWVPLVGIPRFVDDPVLSSKIVLIDEYYADLKAGTLPAVAWITPSGLSEHPPGDLTLGHYFATDLLEALMKSEEWWNSVFIVTWDEWGGWADHVRPPQVDDDGFGLRVPALIVSPWAKRGYVDSTTYDHTSPIALVNTLYDLEPLASRDAAANDLTNAFDFNQEPREPELPPVNYVPIDLAEELEDSRPVAVVYSVVFGALLLGLLVARSLRRYL